MFWHLKNRIKEETGNDVDLIPSLITPNQMKQSKDTTNYKEPSTSLESFTIDSKEDNLSNSPLEIKLADGKVITQKEFKKLESKEDEWRKKLQKKEEKLISKLKKVEESWKKQLDEKEKELQEALNKKEAEKKILEAERDDLKLKNAALEENSLKATDYQKKIYQYQEDIDQLQGFQTQEMAKIKHLLLVKEQELAEKEKQLKESSIQLNLLKTELSRLRNFEKLYENTQDDLEALRHTFDCEKSHLTSKLAEKEEDVRHLNDKVILLEQRVNSKPVGKMTVDERVQKLLGERALFERRLEEAHLHLSQIKFSWSSKIESLETQVGRLCRQVSEESSDKRQAELERDELKAKVCKLEADFQESKSDCESKDSKLSALKLEKIALEEELKAYKLKKDEDIQNFELKIKSVSEDNVALKEKLNEKTNEVANKDELIKSLELKLTEKDKVNELLESKLKTLKDELDNEKKMVEKINLGLEKEQRQKDEMMMRNAQISQEVQLTRQELRKQDLESNELHLKITELEEKLNKKQNELESTLNDKLLLSSKVAKLEKIQKDKEFTSVEEKELKTKITQLESDLFDKNKSVKVLQQRLSDIKKTLQRELKVSSTAIDPGGPDSDGYFSYSSTTSNPQLVFKPISNQHITDPSRNQGEDVCEETCDDVNFKYLKHVLMKFLTSRECEAQHLTRAVATLLRFSAEEEKLLKETLEWKMSWFGTKPNLGNGQTAKTILPR